MFQSPPPPIKLSHNNSRLEIIAKSPWKIKLFFKKIFIFLSHLSIVFYWETIHNILIFEVFYA